MRSDQELSAMMAAALARVDAMAARMQQARLAPELVCVAAGVTFRTWYNIKSGSVLPKTSTLAKLEAALADMLAEQARRESAPELTLHEPAASQMLRMTYAPLLAAVCLRFGVPLEQARGVSKWAQANSTSAHRRALEARRVTIYLLITLHDIPQADIAKAFGISRQAVHQLVQKVEDERDDSRFDALLCGLEEVIQTNIAA
jgi:transcriptional regulator with XRE-family HTH domain